MTDDGATVGDHEGPFVQDANLEELETYLDNLDDPDLVLINDAWYLRDDEAIEGMTPDPMPPEEDIAAARARVAAYEAARGAQADDRSEI